MRTGAKPAESAAEHWYGFETLAVDGAAIALGSVGAMTLDFPSRRQPPRLGLTAGIWYGAGAIGAPSVHYAHGNVGLGLASFGLRTLVPPVSALFGLVGVCVGRGDFERDCVVDGSVGGSLVGLAGSAAIDAGLLAWDRPARVPKPERRWYGYQTFAVDAASLAFGGFLAARRPRDEHGQRLHPALAMWVGSYSLGLFGGPIVHFVNGRWGIGFASFGLRALGGPLGAVPGLIGYCAATAGVRGCTETGAAYGLVGGLIAVDLLDALVLAHDKVETKKTAYEPYVTVGPTSVAIGGYLP